MVNGRTTRKFRKIGRTVAEFRVNGRNGLVKRGKSRLKRPALAPRRLTQIYRSADTQLVFCRKNIICVPAS
jgi:hypothetical protein